MKSPNIKRSISIRGHRTSVTLEEPFWACLRKMAEDRGMALAALVAEIDSGRTEGDNLSSLIRLSVLDWALAGHPAATADR